MSNEQTVAGGAVTHIEIGRAEGELEVLGWDEPHIRIVGLEDDAGAPQISEGVLRLERLEDDVTLSAPRHASLHVLSAKGDVTVRSLLGSVRIDAASGNVSTQDTGSVTLGAVSGDTHLERCQGSARMDAVSGNLEARSLESLLITGAVNGDIDMRDVSGEITVARGVSGDARFTNVGRVAVSTIRGDCTVTQAGSLSINNLNGDLSVQGSEGPCHIGNVRGDAKLRRCGSMVAIDHLGGDLSAHDLRGGIVASRVGGDVHLDTPLLKDASYTIHSAGDIALTIRGEIHARFVAQTFGGTIKTRLPLTVERGRRRHLVGALGRAEAIVTLQSDGGDIFIGAADASQEESMTDDSMTDAFGTPEEAAAGTSWGGFHWGNGGFGIHAGKGSKGFAFSAGFGPDDPDGLGDPRLRRGGKGRFFFDWDDAQRAEYERRIREMSDRTARAARRAAERATEYAERAARRARETDWEGVSREVRQAIERAMGEMEHLLEQFRTGPGAPPRPPRSPDAPPPPPPPGGARAQRVPIEQEEPPATRNKDEIDAARRSILEKLRNGEITLDEAERQLDTLR